AGYNTARTYQRRDGQEVEVRLQRDVYSLWDLKSVEDWTLERGFRRIPRIADVTGFGGLTKRYEVSPDPHRLKRYGVTRQQSQPAVASSNANAGAGYILQGPSAVNVRGIGLLGRGLDPLQQVLGLKQPYVAANRLREEERHRVQELREIVVVSVN